MSFKDRLCAFGWTKTPCAKSSGRVFLFRCGVAVLLCCCVVVLLCCCVAGGGGGGNGGLIPGWASRSPAGLHHSGNGVLIPG